MDDSTQRLISVWSNAVSTFPTVVELVIVCAVLAATWSKISYHARWLTIGLIMIFIHELVRVSYWFPSLFLARPNEFYHPWFIEYRWFSYLVSMPFYLLGGWLIFRSIFPKHSKLVAIAILFSLGISTFATYMFHLSVIGEWDREPVIDWFDETFIHSDDFVREK